MAETTGPKVPEEKEEYFGISRKIVSNMTSQSWQEIPHVTFGYDADVTELMKIKDRLNEGVTNKSDKITLNTIALKIISEGLMRAPKLNCTLEFDQKLVRGTLTYHDDVDVSMPVILQTGEMMTITMPGLQNKTLRGITAYIQDTMRRANNSDMQEVMYDVSLNDTLDNLKNGKISQALNRVYGSKMPGKHQVKTLSGKQRKKYYSIPERDRLTKEDIKQGTTTVSNMGSVGKTYSGTCYLLEIIPPQVTAFAISAVQKRPVVVTDENGNDKIEIRQIMPITIAMDHRALDYADCLPLIERFNEIFDHPEILLTL